MVWGYEEAPRTKTKHLQGYVEFSRSYRLGHLKTIFPTAHWSPTREDSLTNYRYCTKSGIFDSIGDWTPEQNGMAFKASSKASTGMVVEGLI